MLRSHHQTVAAMLKGQFRYQRLLRRTYKPPNQISTTTLPSHQLKGRPHAGKATDKSGRTCRTSDGGDIAQSKTFLVARCRFSWRIGKRDTSLTPQHHNSKEACLTLGSERERAELAQQHQQQQQQQQKNKQQMCPIKRKDDCDTRK